MNFPTFFADSESSFDEADFIIFGVPYDKTSSFRRGASKAPKEIRTASWNFETYNYRTGFDIKDIKIHDYGDLDVESDNSNEMVRKVKDFTTKIISKNKFSIAIGGEHSITAGIIQAFSEDINVISLDAHIDFRHIYENEQYNHACVNRRIADHIDVKNIGVIGIRSADKEEFEDAKKLGLFYIDSFKIQEENIKRTINEIKNYIKNKQVYLTLDIDVIDPAYAPGTSTPEPFGLSPAQICQIIESISSNIIGFDIVEVCPSYDNGQTALLAAKLIRLVIENVVSK